MPNKFIQDVRIVLDDRFNEVTRHLDFAKVLIDKKPSTLARLNQDGSLIDLKFNLDRSLIKTISATGYLLIYNMVESTMTSALDAVHQQLHSDELTFSQLNNKLQRICFKNFKSSMTNFEEFKAHNYTFDDALVWLGYQKKKLWNGNVDAEVIYKRAKEYGFNFDLDYHKTLDGMRLMEVKDKRNQLAHGELSFEQCGQDTAIEDLIAIKEQTFFYLEAVLDGVEVYLEQKDYAVA